MPDPDPNPAPVAAVSEDASALGRRLREIRRGAGLTLEAASAASGVSRAAISKIERGEMSPTYDSLCKLARGFGVDLAALVSDRAPGSGGLAVTRAGSGARHAVARFEHRLLAPDYAGRRLHVFETRVTARSLDAFDQWDRHDSEDFLYVLAGAVAVHLEGREPVQLGPDDSLQMDGRIPHALVALGDGPPPRLLWASVPLEP